MANGFEINKRYEHEDVRNFENIPQNFKNELDCRVFFERLMLRLQIY